MTPDAAAGAGARVAILDRGAAPDVVVVTVLDPADPERAALRRETHVAGLADLVAAIDDDDAPTLRWVWDSTAEWYPRLVAAGVRVGRCHDLRLARKILRSSELAAPARSQAAGGWLDADPDWEDWDGGWGAGPDSTAARLALAHVQPDPLFTDETFGARTQPPPEVPQPPREMTGRDALAQWRAQQALLARLAATYPGNAHRLRLLVAAESSGALAAVELHHDALPFDRAVHEQTLTDRLGERPGASARPARLEALAAQVRGLLDAPRLNPDSLPHLLRELRRNGLDVRSTGRWELEGLDHPVVPPLLEYKRLARLMSANGWAWLDAWVSEGRFRPDYVPAGVVTGRWSSRGGGALSLPHVIRDAVRAEDGWRLVVVDAAQLEPRILAAISGDEAMLAAGEDRDLYGGLVEDGVVDTRAHAKVGMLAVLYGGTSGNAAVLLPRLARAYPRAMAFVDDAARAGEAGGVVTTWLGRSSPPPGADWRQTQAAASDVGADAAQESRARSRARDWGRFTRNFVVQGSAAEWVLIWQAGVRIGLRRIAREHALAPADAPQLAFFLHDELVIHAPTPLVDEVVALIASSARAASTLLFPHLQRPGLVPLDVSVVRSYAEVGASSSDAASGGAADDDDDPGAARSSSSVTESALVPEASTARKPSAS